MCAKQGSVWLISGEAGLVCWSGARARGFELSGSSLSPITAGCLLDVLLFNPFGTCENNKLAKTIFYHNASTTPKQRGLLGRGIPLYVCAYRSVRTCTKPVHPVLRTTLFYCCANMLAIIGNWSFWVHQGLFRPKYTSFSLGGGQAFGQTAVS